MISNFNYGASGGVKFMANFVVMLVNNQVLPVRGFFIADKFRTA